MSAERSLLTKLPALPATSSTALEWGMEMEDAVALVQRVIA
jgi:hypothetical protein